MYYIFISVNATLSGAVFALTRSRQFYKLETIFGVNLLILFVSLAISVQREKSTNFKTVSLTKEHEQFYFRKVLKD
jgi:hypothetical protein